jgi:sulfotransferase 6B1
MKQLASVFSEEIGYVVHSLKYLMAVSGEKEKYKVLVNGSPKTGTTWMYRMMTSVPGYVFVGNFDGEISRYQSVKPGGVVHGHDALTHELKDILCQSGFKVILMIRDPRDQAVSRMFHIRRSPSNRWYEYFRELNDDDALTICIEGCQGLRSVSNLIKLTQTWLGNDYDILCVKYENLTKNPVDEFQKVLEYIGLRVDENFTRAIVLRNRFERLTIGKKIWKSWRKPGQENPNSHFRKGIVGDWRNYFNEQHTERFKEIAGASLIEFGYEENFNW